MQPRRLSIISSGIIAASLILSACAQPTQAPSGQITAAAPTDVPATKAPEATKPAATEATAATEPPAATSAPAAAWTIPSVPAPADVPGDIITAGSSTVYPLSQRMAELYQNEGGGNVTVDSIGTGAGFERFCKTGETDISNASRAIKQEEIDNCKAIGRVPIPFRVGTDALAVVVSADNTFIDYLTFAELATAYSTATTWADVRAGWPAEPIQRYSPGTDSGTFDYFVEAVLRPTYGQDNSADKNAILNSTGTQFSENDATLVAGVEGSPYAIGYFGYAYYAAEGGKLKAVPIVPAKVETPSVEAAVAPSEASVNAATYPLARPLYIYSDAKILADKPQVAAFIGFYLTHVDQEISDIGYFPAPNAALGNSIGTWLDALQLLPDLGM